MSTMLNPMELPIAERNNWFEGLTKRERAVAVAKDVLAQLDVQAYNAKSGTYFAFDNVSLSGITEDSMQVVLDSQSCHVCAIGAAFASVARLGNNVTTTETREALRSHAVNKANELLTEKARVAFTEREVRAMETVFEGYQVGNVFNDDEEAKLIDYRNNIHFPFSFEDVRDEYLMRDIMQNIINNEGRFLVKGVKLSTTKPHKW